MTTARTYIIGFVLSLLCTLAAFWLVGFVLLSREMKLSALVVLALAQLIIQLVCFLHLGRERKAHWNVVAFAFAVFVVAVLVGGTLWIMGNLRQNTDHGMFIGLPSPQTQLD